MTRITGTQTFSLRAQRSCTPLRSGGRGQDARLSIVCLVIVPR